MGLLKFMSSPAGRTVRAVVGVAAIGGGIALGGWGYLLVAVGVVFVAAGVFDFCPLALAFGKPMAGSKLREM